MISIKNRQKKIPISVREYRKKAEKILDFLGYTDFDLGVLWTTDRSIQKYNQKFCSKNKPTDVLSFPYHQNITAGKKIIAKSEEDENLGDIVISVEYVFKNKHQLPGDFVDRMNRMLVHGICHLLGYDHHKAKDHAVMFSLEKKLLKLIQN